MDTKKVIERDNQYVMHTYGRSEVVLASGIGMYARDADGNSYLDFTSGIGVNSLGYCNFDWAEAVAKQAHRLQHTSNLYYTSPCGKLAKRLCKRTGMDKVFFGNSGAEANEGAIKCARKYSFDHYGAGRDTVVTLVNSFHGRTLATLTATGQDVFHQYFGPFNEGFRYVPAGDFAALETAADSSVCAVMLEMIQGEGGVVALDPEYVHAVVEFCRKKDILIIVDEVQTGIGRTGTFLCYEHYGFTPDIVTLAKGLGGGLPIGAVLVTKQVSGGMGPGTHGSTFGGNPVVCAGANVVLDKMDDGFFENVNARAIQLRKGLAALPHVKEVSGLGLMVGIAFDNARITSADVRAKCQGKGLLVLTAKSRLRLLPPLILTEIDVTAALGILKEVLESYDRPEAPEEKTKKTEKPAAEPATVPKKAAEDTAAANIVPAEPAAKPAAAPKKAPAKKPGRKPAAKTAAGTVKKASAGTAAPKKRGRKPAVKAAAGTAENAPAAKPAADGTAPKRRGRPRKTETAKA